jgi:dTDP-4-amino-4,6-dideoxygalactose transaminase
MTDAPPKMNVPLLDLRQQYATIREPVRAAIDAVCDSQALILGKTVEEFEKRLAAYCGTKHAIGLSSGTDALLAIFMAMDLKPGNEIICPSFTFFATAGCIHRAGAKPVFVDIESETFNIDPQRIADAITPRTRGIVPVHLYGQCADMEAIKQVAAEAKHGPVRVIEDAAQAIGATRHGKRAGSMSWCGALSFYPTKNLGGFGDAGAVCTDDEELLRLLKLIRIHGSAHTYYHELVGGNFRIDALQAAVLNVKLDHLEKWHAARQRNAAIYDEMLADSVVITPPLAEGNTSIYNQYVIRIPGDGSERDALKEKLAARGVGSAIYYPLGLHEQKCFAYLGYRKGDLPQTERACREVLALPIFPELTEEQVRYVATQIRDILG